MNKKQTSVFITQQIEAFIKNGGIIKVGRTHKQNKSNTSFSLTRNTIAHRGRKSVSLASYGVAKSHT